MTKHWHGWVVAATLVAANGCGDDGAPTVQAEPAACTAEAAGRPTTARADNASIKRAGSLRATTIQTSGYRVG